MTGPQRPSSAVAQGYLAVFHLTRRTLKLVPKLASGFQKKEDSPHAGVIRGQAAPVRFDGQLSADLKPPA